MKIVSCFSQLEEIKPLAEAGADELYCAIPGLPSFGNSPCLEGRGALKMAVQAAHDRGLKLSLAVNGLTALFTRKGEAKLLGRLAAADSAGVDAFIVAAPAVFALLSALKPRAKVHLSSVQPCFNSLAAEFFISLGVSRIILPNQLAPFEAASIIRLCRGRGVETEIFDYRFFGCAYINGRCHLHGPQYYTAKQLIPKGSMCRLDADLPVPRAINVAPAWKPGLGAITERLRSRFGCGGAPRLATSASFFDFFSGGVDYLKYGTRQDPAGAKVEKIRELRVMAGLAEKLCGTLPRAKARERFIRTMGNWRGGNSCNDGH
jgi:hypothetical protein